MATARADHVARAPTHGHVDRVPRARHHGPPPRPQRDDLQRGPLEADRLPVHVEDHVLGRHPKHFIPRPATDVAIYLATHASPLRCFGHRRLGRSGSYTIGEGAKKHEPRWFGPKRLNAASSSAHPMRRGTPRGSAGTAAPAETR